jgi:hypothetical protein
MDVPPDVPPTYRRLPPAGQRVEVADVGQHLDARAVEVGLVVEVSGGRRGRRSGGRRATVEVGQRVEVTRGRAGVKGWPGPSCPRAGARRSFIAIIYWTRAKACGTRARYHETQWSANRRSESLPGGRRRRSARPRRVALVGRHVPPLAAGRQAQRR